MPKYIVERLFEVGEDQMPDVSRESNRVLATMPEITWGHSHVGVDESGKVRTFCIYEAPDEEAVRRHAKALGLHTVEGITEIAGDATPPDFPIYLLPVPVGFPPPCRATPTASVARHT